MATGTAFFGRACGETATAARYSLCVHLCAVIVGLDVLPNSNNNYRTAHGPGIYFASDLNTSVGCEWPKHAFTRIHIIAHSSYFCDFCLTRNAIRADAAQNTAVWANAQYFKTSLQCVAFVEIVDHGTGNNHSLQRRKFADFRVLQLQSAFVSDFVCDAALTFIVAVASVKCIALAASATHGLHIIEW